MFLAQFITFLPGLRSEKPNENEGNSYNLITKFRKKKFEKIFCADNR
jgi:hypothetical protein